MFFIHIINNALPLASVACRGYAASLTGVSRIVYHLAVSTMGDQCFRRIIAYILCAHLHLLAPENKIINIIILLWHLTQSLEPMAAVHCTKLATAVQTGILLCYCVPAKRAGLIDVDVR